MPTMQYVNPVTGVQVTKNFPSPVKITNVWKGWYKECQKLCPDIPGVPETIGFESARWDAEPPQIDEKWIKFVLIYRLTGERAHLVINRKGPAF